MPGFPALPLDEWRATRDTIRLYSKITSRIRRALAPREKHWFHISLSVAAAGLTTTPIPAGDVVFELLLDFASHELALATSRGERWHMPLRGQSVAELGGALMAALANMGIHPEVDPGKISDTTPGAYDAPAVERFWRALSRIDAVFKRFKGGLRGETSPVQLWPDHFDLAMLWFSGRLVPGYDPSNEEFADEQMNFGFVTGDAGIPKPYYYVTAYPLPAGLAETALPAGAYWHNQGWQGAVLLHRALVDVDDPEEKLLDFLSAVHRAGASFMK